MKKPRSIVLTVLVFVLLLMLTIPVAAGPGAWTTRLSGKMSVGTVYLGGGQWGPGPLTVKVNAWKNADGSVGGQGRLESPALGVYFQFRVTEFCSRPVPSGPRTTYIGQPYAIAIGQDVNSGEWVAIAVVEGFGTVPDAVWLSNGPERTRTPYSCDSLPTDNSNSVYSFPHEVLEGNFDIQTK